MAVKRLFVEVDEKLNEERMRTVSISAIFRTGLDISNFKEPEDFFNGIMVNVLEDGEAVWEAIKHADEIYADTSLTPLHGGAYGSHMLFNNMMHKAITENITGKSIYICRELHRVKWYNLNMKLVDKAFRKNYLFVESEGDGWEQVDIDKLVRDN